MKAETQLLSEFLNEQKKADELQKTEEMLENTPTQIVEDRGVQVDAIDANQPISIETNDYINFIDQST